MFSQFFGQYLLDNQKITAEQFSSCMKYIKDNRVKLGLIAENEGLLTRNQANELNYLQMQTDKRFGDLAVEKGYLTGSRCKLSAWSPGKSVPDFHSGAGRKRHYEP